VIPDWPITPPSSVAIYQPPNEVAYQQNAPDGAEKAYLYARRSSTSDHLHRVGANQNGEQHAARRFDEPTLLERILITARPRATKLGADPTPQYDDACEKT
jgi:hypothetical protein